MKTGIRKNEIVLSESQPEYQRLYKSQSCDGVGYIVWGDGFEKGFAFGQSKAESKKNSSYQKRINRLSKELGEIMESNKARRKKMNQLKNENFRQSKKIELLTKDINDGTNVVWTLKNKPKQLSDYRTVTDKVQVEEKEIDWSKLEFVGQKDQVQMLIQQLQSRIADLEEQRERLIAKLMNAEDKLNDL